MKAVIQPKKKTKEEASAFQPITASTSLPTRLPSHDKNKKQPTLTRTVSMSELDAKDAKLTPLGSTATASTASMLSSFVVAAAAPQSTTSANKVALAASVIKSFAQAVKNSTAAEKAALAEAALATLEGDDEPQEFTDSNDDFKQCDEEIRYEDHTSSASVSAPPIIVDGDAHNNSRSNRRFK